jgi:regulator of sigma E protease
MPLAPTQTYVVEVERDGETVTIAVTGVSTLAELGLSAQVLPVVEDVVPGKPAAGAGLEPGDRIIRVDSETIETFAEVQDIVKRSAGEALSIEIERDQQPLTVVVTPELTEAPDGSGEMIGMIGMQASPALTWVRQSPLEALASGSAQTLYIVEQTLAFIGGLIAGRESADQLSGPIGIASAIGSVASNESFSQLFGLTALLSISIGLFNLFPIPILDGGHLLFYLIEAVRGRPLSPRLQDLGFRIGFALVIFLFIFVTFNDIANLAGS